MKKIGNYILTILCIILISGCGVPQEEHDAIVFQLKTEKENSNAEFNQKISELESVVKSEKAKVKSHRIEMDNAERKLKDLQRKNAESIKDIAKAKSEIVSLKRSVERSDTATDRARASATRAEEELAIVTSERDNLQFRFDQLLNNLNGVEEVVEDSPEDDFFDEFSEVEIEQEDQNSIELITSFVNEMNAASENISPQTSSITAIKKASSNTIKSEKAPVKQVEESKSFFWFLGF